MYAYIYLSFFLYILFCFVLKSFNDFFSRLGWLFVGKISEFNLSLPRWDEYIYKNFLLNSSNEHYIQLSKWQNSNSHHRLPFWLISINFYRVFSKKKLLWMRVCDYNNVMRRQSAVSRRVPKKILYLNYFAFSPVVSFISFLTFSRVYDNSINIWWQVY